jgi:hypothetical protein
MPKLRLRRVRLARQQRLLLPSLLLLRRRLPRLLLPTGSSHSETGLSFARPSARRLIQLVGPITLD